MNIIISKFGDSLTGMIEQALYDTTRCDKPFITDAGRYGDIMAMASRMVDYFSCHSSERATLCLCTDDKRVIAASIIASLSGGPDLVLPYSFSPQVIQDTLEYTRFTHIFGQAHDCHGVTTLDPEKLGSDPRRVMGLKRTLDSPFLTLFTGGSTGKPRAWSKTVRNVFAEAMYLTKKHSFADDDIILATAPPYHIYGFLFSVLIPLVSGARVIDRVCTFPREIINAIGNESPTILVAVPVHYLVLKETPFSGNALRAAFSSSGPLNPEDSDAFYEMTGVPVIEVYGSTETGGIATRCRARRERSLRIFDNVDWKIEDERLCVRSEFISPTLHLDENGFFITGDRAEKEGSDSFRLLGRADGIVKIGGKRIDLAEMQEKICALSGVADCVIVPLESRNGKELELGALVEGSIDDTALKDSMRALFEPYALPRRARIVAAIPRAATGKYDRKKILEFFS